MVVAGKQPHRLRRERSYEGVDVLPHDIRRGAFDIDRDQSVAELGEPCLEPSTASTQALAEPVMKVIERCWPTSPESMR